jgi:site-specific recombinase XerC
MDTDVKTEGRTTPRNKGKLLGQKLPLKVKEIWAIPVRLQLAKQARELALFNLAIDSKLRGCDLVGLRVHDLVQGSHVAARAIVMRRKTQRPVQFEITEQTREAVATWVKEAHRQPEQFSVSKPGIGVTPSFDPAVFSHCRAMGRIDWARPRGVRYSFAQAYQADADLPPDQESPGRSTPAGSHQTRKHDPIPRDRGRRCAGDCGAN